MNSPNAKGKTFSTDRTDAFLLQLNAFRELNFTGETTLQWNNGQIREIGLHQRIRRIEDTGDSPPVLLQATSVGAALDSSVRSGIA